MSSIIDSLEPELLVWVDHEFEIDGLEVSSFRGNQSLKHLEAAFDQIDFGFFQGQLAGEHVGQQRFY